MAKNGDGVASEEGRGGARNLDHGGGCGMEREEEDGEYRKEGGVILTVGKGLLSLLNRVCVSE